jgi:hypothetical protein
LSNIQNLRKQVFLEHKLNQLQHQRLPHHLVHHHQQLNQSQHLLVFLLEIQLEAMDKQQQLAQQQLLHSLVLGQLD